MSENPRRHFTDKVNKDFNLSSNPPPENPKNDKGAPANQNDIPQYEPYDDEDEDVFTFGFGTAGSEVPEKLLRDLAEKTLPKTPEIKKALTYCDNLDFLSLLSAISVQQELKGQVPAAKLDRLTAAALLRAAENIDDIESLFHKDTMSITDEYLALTTQDPDDGDDSPDISEVSKDARRLFLCNVIADLQATSSGVTSGALKAPTEDSMRGLGQIVNRLSEAEDTDDCLLTRTAEEFNKLSDTQNYAVKLILSEDGFLEAVRKKDPPPAQPQPKIKPPKP